MLEDARKAIANLVHSACDWNGPVPMSAMNAILTAYDKGQEDRMRRIAAYVVLQHYAGLRAELPKCDLGAAIEEISKAQCFSASEGVALQTIAHAYHNGAKPTPATPKPKWELGKGEWAYQPSEIRARRYRNDVWEYEAINVDGHWCWLREDGFTWTPEPAPAPLKVGDYFVYDSNGMNAKFDGVYGKVLAIPSPRCGYGVADVEMPKPPPTCSHIESLTLKFMKRIP